MAHVLAEVNFEDLPRLLGVFSTRGAEMRGEHGRRGSKLFKVEGERNKAVALFEWESREAFEGFLADPLVKVTMKSSGTLGFPPPQGSLQE